jgi:hypothetical protein
MYAGEYWIKAHERAGYRAHAYPPGLDIWSYLVLSGPMLNVVCYSV